MTEQDQKYLAEEMGLCWHEPKYGYWENCRDGKYGVPCKCCGIRLYDTNGGDEIENIDFSSEHGFFVAWEWSKKQEWWDIFNSYMNDLATNGEFLSSFGLFPISLIGPRFAEELVAYLKQKKVEGK